MTQSSRITVERHILWQAHAEPGIEHLHLRAYQDRVVADGFVVGVAEGQPVRLHYQVQCDPTYRFQTLHLAMLHPAQRTFSLSLAHDGTWNDGAGSMIPSLTGSSEIDLSASPFTNTLPVRRLSLGVAQSAEIQVAYIAIPDLAISRVSQRYTLLERAQNYHVYRFEHLATGFTADIRVDPDGLVLFYPGLFQRVWSQ